MTMIEICREYFPGIPDEVARDVVLTCTGFPGCFLGNDAEAYYRNQLSEISARSNQNPHLAMAICEQELDDEMKKYKERKIHGE